MNDPTKEHMNAAHKIPQLLKIIPVEGKFFNKTSNKDIQLYKDVD